MTRFLLILLLCQWTVRADSWAPPVEEDYTSRNGRYIAHVTPAKEERSASLDLYEQTPEGRGLRWSCVLGNEGAPQEVFVADDGVHVVTVNECSHRVHGGMGDYVLAFYRPSGVIKHYSLEELLGYPERITRDTFDDLVTYSASGRSWSGSPMFFDATGDKLVFCIWLYEGKQWRAWDAKTGEPFFATPLLTERWNKKALQWARTSFKNAIKHNKNCGRAVLVLSRFKEESDRPLIKSLLTRCDFRTIAAHRNKIFTGYCARSMDREWAEKLLASWPGTPPRPAGQECSIYRYLGVVKGTITLPRPPRAGDGHLCIYLVPGDTVPDDWYKTVPVHRLSDYFWKFSFTGCSWPKETFPFRIEGVTPGRYRVKAVWDCAGRRTFGDDYIKGPPDAGDFESTTTPCVTIRAGMFTKGVKIDCTRKVEPDL